MDCRVGIIALSIATLVSWSCSPKTGEGLCGFDADKFEGTLQLSTDCLEEATVTISIVNGAFDAQCEQEAHGPSDCRETYSADIVVDEGEAFWDDISIGKVCAEVAGLSNPSHPRIFVKKQLDEFNAVECWVDLEIPGNVCDDPLDCGTSCAVTGTGELCNIWKE